MTRPITARVKVALFDRLQPILQQARVADIFAGTGTQGFEALSRGAQSVVFIENDRKAFELLRRNVAALHAEEDVLCWRVPAEKCSFHPQRGERFLPFDVIFFDPPYRYVERMREGTMLYKSLTRLARDAISAPEALLVLRCARKTEFEMPPEWKLERSLEFSTMVVHLFRKIRPDAGDDDRSTVEEEVAARPEQPDSSEIGSHESE